MFNFQEDNRKYKLYNLAESLHLALDDYDEEDQGPVTVVRDTIKSHGVWEVFAEKRILKECDEPLDPIEEAIIAKVNNDTDHKYDSTVSAKDQLQLQNFIRRGVKYFGMEGNYNWIDTSSVTSLLMLFKNALGDDRKNFNGDISRWDVRNVKYLKDAFNGCTALTCDISGWNTENVTIEAGAGPGTNDIFKQYYKKLKFPKHFMHSISKSKT